MARKASFCRNREIVHAGQRHSPKYDLEGFEADWWPSQSLCTVWACGAADVNAWHYSADNFIHGELEEQIAHTIQSLKKAQGGNLLPAQKLELGRAQAIIDQWDEEWGDYSTQSQWGAAFKMNPLTFYRDQAMEIVSIFDKAACETQDLIDMQPEGAFSVRPPQTSTKPQAPGGSYFGGGDDESSGIGLGGGMAIMIGLGLAGFIGYKAMTE
jgi:hypothetical protein